VRATFFAVREQRTSLHHKIEDKLHFRRGLCILTRRLFFLFTPRFAKPHAAHPSTDGVDNRQTTAVLITCLVRSNTTCGVVSVASRTNALAASRRVIAGLDPVIHLQRWMRGFARRFQLRLLCVILIAIILRVDGIHADARRAAEADLRKNHARVPDFFVPTSH
jgi:hypothetical protein